MPKYASKAKFLAPSGAQGVSLSVCLSVCPSGTSLSKALNLHLSLIVLSQICLRSVSGLSVPTSSERRGLKYFVLFLPENILQVAIICLGDVIKRHLECVYTPLRLHSTPGKMTKVLGNAASNQMSSQ